MEKKEIEVKQLQQVIDWMQKDGYDRKATQEIAPIIVKYLNQQPSWIACSERLPEKKYFKVSFQYEKDTQGRSLNLEHIRVFDAVDSDELNNKIEKYISDRTNSPINRWYYATMTNIESI